MPETLSEIQGCELLSRLFRSRGFAIARNVDFHEYGVSFHVDGWDAQARVGFEFLTSEDDDHDDLSLEEYKALMAAQQRGELSLFIIDEVEPLSAAELIESANEFLDEVADAVQARSRRASTRNAAARPATPRRPAAKASAAAGRKVGRKPAGKTGRKPGSKLSAAPAARKTAKKAARKKPAGKKPVAKKAAGKKTVARRRRSAR